MQRISILGLGWLGLPLALHLQGLGYAVQGSKRDSEAAEKLRSQGIKAYPLELAPTISSEYTEQLFACDLLIINIPPGRRLHDGAYHQQQILSLAKMAEQHQVSRVIFISSTSVYGSMQGDVDETSLCQPDTDSGKTLVSLEKQLQEFSFELTILRLAGLIGPKRQPGRFLSGKHLPGPDSPVNLIHLDDAVELVSCLVQSPQTKLLQIFNGCSDQHPTKQQFYAQAAALLEIAPPQFTDQAGSNKVISNQLITQQFNFQFKYPDPMQWLLHQAENERNND